MVSLQSGRASMHLLNLNSHYVTAIKKYRKPFYITEHRHMIYSPVITSTTRVPPTLCFSVITTGRDALHGCCDVV